MTRKRVKSDESSLRQKNMSFLLEDVDRSSYDRALQYIEPLSELEDEFDNMPRTKAALRQAINRVEVAISAAPDPILSAVGLSDSQKELVNACTAAEVLKLSILNSFDAVRQLLITEFNKSPKFYDDEAIELKVLAASPSRPATVRFPRRVPFSSVPSQGDYTVYWQTATSMIIGKEADSGRLYDVVWNIPGTSSSITIDDVPAGKIYLTSREEGDPAPVNDFIKSRVLGIAPTPRGNLDRTLDDISKDTSLGKTFDLGRVVERNYKVPAPAMGTVETIYRTIRMRPAVTPPSMPASDLADDMRPLTLAEFKKYFKALVARTTTATGDITTYNVEDALILGGLAWVGGLLGITRASTAPTGAPAAAGAAGAGAVAGAPAGGSGGGAPAAGTAGGGRAPRTHSLSNILGRPSVVAGATPAEREANLRLINQDALRRELNALVGGNVVFTEGTVDRWSELAGIKECK